MYIICLYTYMHFIYMERERDKKFIYGSKIITFGSIKLVQT